VTGGATGIGLATARALAARGATVAIFNRNQERAQAAVTGLCAAGAAAHAYATDIADPASVETAFGTALEQLQRVDILVNNSGITRDGLFMRMSDAQWQEVIDTNLGGAFRCARAVARFRHRGWQRPIFETHIHFYQVTRPGGVPWPPDSDTPPMIAAAVAGTSASTSATGEAAARL